MSEVTKTVFNEKTGVNEEYRYRVMTGCKITFSGYMGKISEEVFTYIPDDKEIGELILKNNAKYAYIQEIKYLEESNDLPFC